MVDPGGSGRSPGNPPILTKEQGWATSYVRLLREGLIAFPARPIPGRGGDRRGGGGPGALPATPGGGHDRGMETRARRRASERRATRRRRWPAVEAPLAARLRHAGPGAGRRAVLLGWIACIGEPVRPGPPAADSRARERWEELRRAELHRQIDLIRILRGGDRGRG
jgi:hypothetical protein